MQSFSKCLSVKSTHFLVVAQLTTDNTFSSLNRIFCDCN